MNVMQSLTQCWAGLGSRRVYNIHPQFFDLLKKLGFALLHTINDSQPFFSYHVFTWFLISRCYLYYFLI
jgi:hypothetical protein